MKDIQLSTSFQTSGDFLVNCFFFFLLKFFRLPFRQSFLMFRATNHGCIVSIRSQMK